MAIYEGDYLKGRFEDGDKPTGQDFIDLIDSTLNSTVTSLSAGTDEKFRVFQENTILAEINEDFYRPAEVELLYGDSSPARKELGWVPDISFDMLVERMVKHDLAIAKRSNAT